MMKRNIKTFSVAFVLALLLFLAIPANIAQAKTINHGVYYGKSKVNIGFNTGRIWNYWNDNCIELTISRDGKQIGTKKVNYSYEDWQNGVTRYIYEVSKPGKYAVKEKNDPDINKFTIKKASAIKKYKPKISVSYYSDRKFVAVDTNWVGAKKIKIYRKVGNKGKWKCLKTVSPGEEFLDYNTKPKKKYSYRALVVATDGKKNYKSKYSAVKYSYHN